MRDAIVRIAAVGLPSTGKSSVLNALFGTAFPVAPEAGTTRVISRVLRGNVEVIDTPPPPVHVAADAWLLVCDKDLTVAEVEEVQRRRRRPLAVVLNKCDTFSKSQLRVLLQRIRGRVSSLVAPDRVVACAADPVAIRWVERDGELHETVEHRPPDVRELRRVADDLIAAARRSPAVIARRILAG